ncbi:MAG: indole-3-glycerol-phosphate synthase [Thermoleophilia bacterium]|nr:indole-3-glycerol-phosphate synthase [Thermoleophilia bacterium]
MTADAQGTYLDDIVRDVRARLELRIDAWYAGDGAGERDGITHAQPPARSLMASISARRTAGELAVIAEVKRRSPSVGAIDLDADPAARAGTYAAHGAAGISVLTEPDHFGGDLADLAAARSASGATPLLRKDFILDEFQIWEATRFGADAVLLIAALHDEEALRTLLKVTHSLGMEALVEVHDEAELERTLAAGAQLIGINSRNLTTFAVDLAVVEWLAPRVPADRLLVAESGIKLVSDAQRVRDAGVDAVLVGEALMRSAQPDHLLGQLRAVGPGELRT